MRRWCLVVALAPLGVARAQVISSDSFVCATGQLDGEGGGVGWTGTWTTGQPTVFLLQAPPSLQSTAAGSIGELGGFLKYDGSKANSSIGARAFRHIDLTSSASVAKADGFVSSTADYFGNSTPALGVVGTTAWVGFLVNGGTAGNGISGNQYLAQMHLYHGDPTGSLSLGDQNKDGEVMAIGRGAGNTQWNFERTCAHDVCGAVTSSTSYVSQTDMDANTHWLVIRFAFTSSTSTAVTMWLDPTPGATDPSDPSALALAVSGSSTYNATNSVPAVHFDWIELGGETATFSFDEVRVAETFAALSAGGSNVDCNGTGGPDAGVAPRIDAGSSPPIDAGSSSTIDAGGSSMMDAAPGSTVDAARGGNGDAAAGPGVDAGTGGNKSGGCGCRTAGGGGSPSALVVLAALTLLVRRRRAR
jgi:MYXO-CTERM domain-containing protein